MEKIFFENSHKITKNSEIQKKNFLLQFSLPKGEKNSFSCFFLLKIQAKKYSQFFLEKKISQVFLLIFFSFKLF